MDQATAMDMATATSPATGHHPHYPALVGFLSDPSSHQWSDAHSGWNPANPDICHWAGITCEAFPDRGYAQVVGVNIPCTPGPGELRATLPAELGMIDTLRELTAYDCDLVGTIPTELAGLPHLQKLLLGYNSLSGTIPHHFASNDLTGIWLEHNNLHGAMPSQFGTVDDNGHNRSTLMTLSLTANHLTGSIPDSLADIETFEVMELSTNEMTGSLPSWLKQLDFVELTHNRFNSSVPLGVCDVVGDNLEHYVLDGNPGLEGCGDGVMAVAGMYMSRLDWLWPFVLGALVFVLLVARLALFMKRRCGKCRCPLPRWECSCPDIKIPPCPKISCPEMPKMPPISWPRIICPRIYLPSLPLFSRKKAKVLDESTSDFHMTQEWGTARRRWWQRRSTPKSDPKSAEIDTKKQQLPPPPPRSSPIKQGESVRPKMSRRNSWSALADRVESRRTAPASAGKGGAVAKNKRVDNDDGGGEEEVWFVPIPKNFDEQSAVIDDGAEEIMDISIPRGYEGNATAAKASSGDGEKKSSKKRKKKKKKSQRVGGNDRKDNTDQNDEHGDGGWRESSRHQLM